MSGYKAMLLEGTAARLEEIKAAMKEIKDKRMYERYQYIFLFLSGESRQPHYDNSKSQYRYDRLLYSDLLQRRVTGVGIESLTRTPDTSYARIRTGIASDYRQ